MVVPLQSYNQVRLNSLIAGVSRDLLRSFGEFETVVEVLGGIVTDSSMSAGKLTQGNYPSNINGVPIGQAVDSEAVPITEEDFEWYKTVVDQMQGIVDDLRGKDREGALTLIRMLSRLDQ